MPLGLAAEVGFGGEGCGEEDEDGDEDVGDQERPVRFLFYTESYTTIINQVEYRPTAHIVAINWSKIRIRLFRETNVFDLPNQILYHQRPADQQQHHPRLQVQLPPGARGLRRVLCGGWFHVRIIYQDQQPVKGIGESLPLTKRGLRASI